MVVGLGGDGGDAQVLDQVVEGGNVFVHHLLEPAKLDADASGNLVVDIVGLAGGDPVGAADNGGEGGDFDVEPGGEVDPVEGRRSPGLD